MEQRYLPQRCLSACIKGGSLCDVLMALLFIITRGGYSQGPSSNHRSVTAQRLASFNDPGTFGSKPSNLIQPGAKKVRLASVLEITLHAVSRSEGRQCLTSCLNEAAESPDWPGDRTGSPTPSLAWLQAPLAYLHADVALCCFLFWNSHFFL